MSRGRGRGGRGGGGSGKSLNRDQLNSLGVGPNDLIPILGETPPPLFPLLEKKPVELVITADIKLMLVIRQNCIDKMQLSTAHLNKSKSSQTNHDDSTKSEPKEKYDWNMFPIELRPKLIAMKGPRKIISAQVKEINIEEKFSKLENLEMKTAEIKQELAEDEDVEEEEEELAAAANEDEEMDDGTDYANNYFDNGEGYEDEDDLDEGPIY